MPSYSVSDANRILLNAAFFGDVERFDFALANGADITRSTEPNPSHSSSHTPELVGKAGLAAALRGTEDYELTEERIAIVKKLLALGIDVNVPLNTNHLPLYLAASSGHQELVDLLFQHGAKLSKSNEKRNYLLSASFHNRLFQFAEMQLEYLMRLPQDKQVARELEDALYMAVSFKQIEFVEMLLEHGVSANARESHGQGLGDTALISAAQRGYNEIVALLRAHSANLYTEGRKDSTILTAAVSGQLMELTQEVLANGDASNTTPNSINQALHSAAGNGRSDFVRLLLEHGANLRDSDEFRCVLTSAARGGLIWLAEACLKAGESVDFQDHWKRTPLMVATESGHIPMVQFLVERGAQINHVATYDMTPLHSAIYTEQVEAVKWLIEHGADLNAEVMDHMDADLTPLMNAIRRNHVGIVRILLAAGADVKAQEPGDAETALHTVAYTGNVEIATLLLQAGAHIDTRNGDGNTPLLCAAREGYHELATLFIAAGANVNVIGHCENTPLHNAAKDGHVMFAQQLLAAGADRHALNAKGQTPLDLAIYEGFPRVIKLLLQ